MILDNVLQWNEDNDDVSMSIVVDYNPAHGVTEIINITIIDNQTNQSIQITDLLSFHFQHQIWSMVEKIDWHQIFIDRQSKFN
jgi:capsular polysaccharide biosynthesis protein